MDLTVSFVYFLLQHVLYLAVSLGLLLLLCTSERIPSYFFVLNLILASIFSVLLLLLIGLDDYSVVDIKGPWLCGIQAFMKKLATGVLSLTVFGISFERVRCLPRLSSNTADCSFPLWKVFCLTWGAAGLLASPRFHAYEYFTSHSHPDTGIYHQSLSLSLDYDITNNYDSHWNDSLISSTTNSSSYCRKTPLLGKVWVKILYEAVLCVLLSFFPPIYNIYALYRIKFKIKYIFPIKSLRRTLGPSLYKRLKHIRLASLYSLLFALVMIPYGIVTVWRSYTEDPYRVVVNENFKSPKKSAQKYLEGAFMTLHPVLYLYTHHHTRFTSFFKICKLRSCRQAQAENADEDEVMAVSTIQLETFQPTA